MSCLILIFKTECRIFYLIKTKHLLSSFDLRTLKNYHFHLKILLNITLGKKIHDFFLL